MNATRILTALTALMLTATSCYHKELCLEHDEHALSHSLHLKFQYDQLWHEDYSYYNNPDVDVDGKWVVDLTQQFDRTMPQLLPELPGGIRVIDYAPGGEQRLFNLRTEGGTISIAEGIHEFLFYNNDSQMIVIDSNSGSANEIVISTRSRVRSSYQGSPYASRAENTVAAPDMLYFGYIDSYQTGEASATADTATVLMRPLVCTYVIVFNFEQGAENVVLARGALSGMAGSVKLHNGETGTDDLATILFDCELLSEYAQAVVNTFGIPGYKLQSTVIGNTDSSRRYGLNLELRLRNGNIVTFDYDVTDQVSLQPQGGVITIDDIIIDDSESETPSSGFSAEVEGWGEYKDFALPL